MAIRTENKYFNRLGSNIKDARAERGISQVALAKLADIDRSYIIGNQIILGKYKSNSQKLASFFHELGHLLVSGALDKYNAEEKAWEVAYQLMKNSKIKLHPSTVKWCNKQLQSYEQFR